MKREETLSTSNYDFGVNRGKLSKKIIIHSTNIYRMYHQDNTWGVKSDDDDKDNYNGTSVLETTISSFLI